MHRRRRDSTPGEYASWPGVRGRCMDVRCCWACAVGRRGAAGVACYSRRRQQVLYKLILVRGLARAMITVLRHWR